MGSLRDLQATWTVLPLWVAAGNFDDAHSNPTSLLMSVVGALKSHFFAHVNSPSAVSPRSLRWYRRLLNDLPFGLLKG